ncbi:MAG TPA: low molecular weight protein-tyrosine-phosphatase [Myxococcota bacterium]
MRLLMVCLGNICRSPTAEATVRREAQRRGVDVVVASCGTGGWHAGEGADARTIRHAKKRGIDLEPHRARQLHDDDFAAFDHIFVMDAQNLSDVLARCPPEHHGKVRRFLGDDDVPDPWFGGADGFERVLDLCEAASARLLDELRAASVSTTTTTT